MHWLVRFPMEARKLGTERLTPHEMGRPRPIGLDEETAWIEARNLC